MKYDISHALVKLCPNCAFCMADDIYESIQWNSNNILPLPTKEDLELCVQQMNAEEPMRLLRIERNKRLTECDWIVIRAYSRREEVPLEWQNYMQALRDLPSQCNPSLTNNGELDFTSVNWPIKPN